jgi:hypothetical protein
MAKLKLEAAWREKFTRIGAGQFRDPRDSGLTEEPKGLVSLPWAGDEAESRRLLDEQTHHYFQWTSVAVVAAVIVGLILFGLTLLH